MKPTQFQRLHTGPAIQDRIHAPRSICSVQWVSTGISTVSDSPNFVDQQRRRLCGHACRSSSRSGHDEPAGSTGASSEKCVTPKSVPMDTPPLGPSGIISSDLERPATPTRRY